MLEKIRSLLKILYLMSFGTGIQIQVKLTLNLCSSHYPALPRAEARTSANVWRISAAVENIAFFFPPDKTALKHHQNVNLQV